MAAWFPVCRADEVPEGCGRTCEVSGLRIALVRDGATLAALSDRCPHAGGSLGRGWVEDGELICPLHRWRFRLRDGRCTTMRGCAAHRFDVEVRDDTVWVRV